MRNMMLNNDLKFREFALNKFKSKITFQKKSYLGFDKYIYTNKEAEYVIPFRLKSAKIKICRFSYTAPARQATGTEIYLT